MAFSFFKKKQPEVKNNPPQTLFADERTRGALNKVLLPNFLFKPPFGTPRNKNLLDLRRLGNGTQPAIAKQTIIDEVVSIPWDIVAREDEEEMSDQMEAEALEIKTFLLNPNTRNDSFEFLMRQMLPDVLDFDSGVWVKEFDVNERMAEIIVADGASFLKNPNIHGRYTERSDIIPEGFITLNKETGEARGQVVGGLTIQEAADTGAYFQFGFLTTSRPIAFGRREIVWFEKNPQTMQIYGKAPTETLKEVIQTLIYSIEYNLDYFEDNNVPKGFIQLAGADQPALEQFRDRWNELQLKTNPSGLIKKNFHRVPITGSENASFVKVQFSAQELQLIESQTWFSKLVWAMYGVTPSELGFTEDSNRATEVGQGRIFKRKAVLPLLRMMEHYINNNILTEWDFGDKYEFKFNTFDIEDEKSKYELYKIQRDTNLKSINEIRREEGLDEVEGGDHEANPKTEVTQEMLDQMNEDPKEEEKALTTASPLAPKEGEVANRMKKELRKKEKLLLAAIRAEAKQDRLTQIKSQEVIDWVKDVEVKSLSNLVRVLSEAVSFNSFKSLIRQAVEGVYKKGFQVIEKLTDETIQPNQEQIQFLATNTFSNIKGMEDDLANKLRQQLSMSIMNGEGVAKTTDRVRSVFDVTETRLEAISRTELNRVENFGQLEAAKKSSADLRKYIIIVDDDRTSEISKAMDRKYGSEEKSIPLNEPFEVTVKGKTVSAQAPPFHVNERDTIVFTTFDPTDMKSRLKEALNESRGR